MKLRGRLGKRLLVGAAVIVVLLLVSYLAIAIISMLAVSNFRESATKQLNPVINGDDTNQVQAATLAYVPAAKILNPTYKKVANAQTEYHELLNSARSYNLVKKYQDKLVKFYNDNSNASSDPQLSAGILNDTNSYLSVIKNNYRDQSSRIDELKNLASLISNSTNFSQISSQLDTVIANDSNWIDSLRSSLNTEILNFQKIVD